MIAILTGKQTVAKQIAQALDIDMKTGNGEYFYGRGFMVAWASGEPVTFLPPEDSGRNRLAKSGLPFIPEAFTLSVRKKKTQKGWVADKAAVKQLELIQNIFNGCSSLIAATDASEAGELVFRNAYAFLNCSKPFKRLWLNSLAANAIREGFKNPKESSLYDNLYAAAGCRVKADYMVKFNASRAFSLATGLANHPLGRLQTPTLAMVCKRFFEHRKFISTRFFEHRISLGKDGLFLHFTLGRSGKSKRKAEKTYAYLKTFHTALVTKVEAQTVILPAPELYNLAALQEDANLRYGFSAAQTLEIAWKLYEGKFISHPLADSRSIPENIFHTIPKILRQTAAYCGLADSLQLMDWENLNRRSLGDMDASTHHALLPTGVYPGYQPKNSKLVYNMVAARTLEAFAPDCEKEAMRVEAAIGNLVLESKQSRVTVPGWLAVQNRGEGKAEGNAAFPAVEEGETVQISGWNLITKKTLPPPLYTEASLLAAMENARLGTSETRTTVIEALFENNYIERRGQNIVPAEKGLVVYNCVKDMRIASVEQSGGWERMLSGVACGKQDAETFMAAFKIFTRQVTEEILALGFKPKSSGEGKK
jgi:DNA topoisomerase-3